MSGFGNKAVKLAARIADGYRCVQPNTGFVRLYRESGGGDRPVQGGLKVCWGADAGVARKTMHRLWRTDQIPSEAVRLLPVPRQFSQVAELISEEDISAPCGPDVEDHLRGIGAYADAGFDEVYIGQVGSEQDGFFEFYAEQVLPRLREG
jgi:G6PDH family F420-dependent oxidoreductase